MPARRRGSAGGVRYGDDALDGVLEGLSDGWVQAGGAVVLTRGSRSFTPVIPVHWLVARRLEYGDTAVLILREA